MTATSPETLKHSISGTADVFISRSLVHVYNKKIRYHSMVSLEIYLWGKMESYSNWKSKISRDVPSIHKWSSEIKWVLFSVTSSFRFLQNVFPFSNHSILFNIILTNKPITQSEKMGLWLFSYYYLVSFCIVFLFIMRCKL